MVSAGSVTLHDTTIVNSGIGVSAYAIMMGATYKIWLDGCVLSKSNTGVYAATGSDVTVSNSTINDNNTGVLVFDGGIVRLMHNTITGNVTGIQNISTVHSTGDNLVEGNGTDLNGGAITPATKM